MVNNHTIDLLSPPERARLPVPRILITGKDGQVGFELQRSLAIIAKVIALGRQDGNLSDSSTLKQTIKAWNPDIIVNAAAWTAVDQAQSDPENCHAVNARAPAELALLANELNALLVHYSTDYVFDGRKQGRYLENDCPNPLSVYGHSKWAGEQAAQTASRHLILRTSWVYSTRGSNFLKTILRLARTRETLTVVADQIGAPTAASLIADVSAYLLTQYWVHGGHTPFPYGIYHLVASGETSWHRYAQQVVCIASRLGIPLTLTAEAIEPINTSAYPLPAPRPANSCLDTSKLRSTFNLNLPNWQQGIQQALTLLADV